ncbi:VWA domain-containing protein [Saccharothrix mutabilis subsp. mutabilis]|uniref:VWA domain-containing protein n=1 Tax=Saccharothrix mutabilis subsp. mutabilis TaxID=66855 RepID=A0ABN0UUJ1_9PSEU
MNRTTAVALAGVLLGGALLADRPAAQAQPEPLKPYRIGFSRVAAGDEAGDLWSTDSRGGNPRATTASGVPHDTDPAYSPDGTRLAWTQQADGGVVKVANADGSDQRTLRGEDPTWSPDGTRLAVTDGGEIVVLRVADGVELARIPFPDHLDGRDHSPAWSPDGRTIAFSRDTDAVEISQVHPRSVSGSTPLGGSFTTTASLRTPNVPARPEIMFLLDTTGSMGPAISAVRTNLGEAMRRITEKEPLARFGIAAYQDASDGESLRYQPATALTTREEVKKVLDDPEKLKIGWGGDGPEDWFNALHRVTQDRIFTEPGTSRIAVVAGDAASHNHPDQCGDYDGPNSCATAYPYWEESRIERELKDLGIHLVAVPVVIPDDGDPETPPYPEQLNSREQASRLTAATGGVLTEGHLPDQVVAGIQAGIERIPVTVTPRANCPDGVSIEFTPPSVTVPGNTDVRFQETVRLEPLGPRLAAVGDRHACTVDFLFNGVQPGQPHVQTIRVTEAAAGLPTVVVNGDTAVSPGGTPVAVPFTASATSVTGEPLTPTCDAEPTDLFPVGVTTVTCAASENGRGNRAGAPVAVVVPETRPSEDIWLADVSGPLRQANLSRLFAQDCARDDTSPAWSPDGARLVFAHAGRALCVADASGANARPIFTAELCLDSPAWSPDGALIAFDQCAGEFGATRIWRVAPSGGPATVLVADPAAQVGVAAFQPLPDLAVAAAVAPAAIPFEGTTTARFTVTNTGLAPTSPTVTLTVPPGLRVDTVTTTAGTCAGTTCTPGRVPPRGRVEIRVTVTGTAAGSQVVAADAGQDVNPGDNRAQVIIRVADPIKPPANPGSLSMAVAVLPQEGFVGGDDIVLSYKVRNGAGEPMTDVRVVTSLPPQLTPVKTVAPGCAADGSVCTIGVLQPLQEADVRITLPAKAAVDTIAGGSVLGVGPDNNAADNTAVARVLVRQPKVTVDPLVGPGGFVPRAVGSGFPPGGTVRLAWTVGISATPGTVVVRDDGTFEAQVLVFDNDLVGPRELAATAEAGPGFALVRSNPFLVVPKSLQPPDFVGRG